MEKNNRKTRLKTSASESKYDSNDSVISKAYGAYAELRRELGDSKEKIAERSELLKYFANCSDEQRAWLLLEDYFEKLGISRKDFIDNDWWSKLIVSKGNQRLQELTFLFMRSGRSVPSELSDYADYTRFSEIQKLEEEQKVIIQLEQWIMPEHPNHIDRPRAKIRIITDIKSDEKSPMLHFIEVAFDIFRSSGVRETKNMAEMIDIANRPPYELEQFSKKDLEFLKWLLSIYKENSALETNPLRLSGEELFKWLVRWGNCERLEIKNQPEYLKFHGESARIEPEIVVEDNIPYLWFNVITNQNQKLSIDEVKFFSGIPTLCLNNNKFYVIEKNLPGSFFDYVYKKKKVAISKLTNRFKVYLRSHLNDTQINGDEICVVHTAKPRFVFELDLDTIRLRLLAVSDKDGSLWQWNGYEWEAQEKKISNNDKPQILDDKRLDDAVHWLRKLDLFTPEHGLWIGDATEGFLTNLASIWQLRPKEAEYFGNQSFNRLFLEPSQVRPQIMVKGSGIDWLSVSTEWEIEGLKLTKADIERLAGATSRFVKLPDTGWVELDIDAVIKANETASELGLEGLTPIPDKIPLEQFTNLKDQTDLNFADTREAAELKKRLKDFKKIEEIPVPEKINATLRSYQKEGFWFLCHLTKLGLGGILADDMGLGKTLQTLTWLKWLKETKKTNFKPALVICPASVLHNWRREAERFTPDLKVLLLESGSARHNLRKKIPHNELIITSYALLRRDLQELLKFNFSAIIVDEAQFIKNPDAQITTSVKQLNGEQKIALTGTPLENRLLDLWSIVDFIQPGYLGSQSQFHQNYDPPINEGSEESITQAKIARKRLSAKLRPLLIRRLKQQVATELPDKIEERRDCELCESQKKLYLAELRRSKEQIDQIVVEQGIGHSKIHVLAALTRLRQICCHPSLVGSDAPSGKTETLFELLEPLIAEGHKVLLFSQFVQMLKILEAECKRLEIPTFMLTGETKDRMQMVNNFQNATQPCVFLLSLRAAGTGLNLTNASYVVLYDPWWNPAVESQAIDRSHRIGQTKTVNAYRLVSPGTVEEKIWELQQRKAQTIGDVLGEKGFTRSLTREDIEYLFS